MNGPPYPPDSQPEEEDILDVLFEEISGKVQAGEAVDIEEYSARFPEHATRLRGLLNAARAVAAIGKSDINNLQSPPSPILGDFRLVRIVGRGGMGVVYEAEHISVGHRVAIKILPFAALLNETQLQRFNTEATAAARLQRTGIVRVYTVGYEHGIHFYAMQFIDGPSVAHAIAEMRSERQFADEAEAADTIIAQQANVLTRDDDGGNYRAIARIGKEAADALHYAHENGVLHRDVKPSNLLLDKEGHVWIADFGLARVEDESQLTRTGDILGTLRYMSPEQAKGERHRVDARSDVYSLGATLYEMATLQPVYDAQERREITKQVLAGSPVAPHKVDSRIPKPLSLVISKSMARLDERYQSAREMAEDLQRFLDGEAVSAKPTLLRQSKAWARRHRVVSAALVGLLVLVVLLPFTSPHFFGRTPDSPVKRSDKKVSETAKVAAAAERALVTARVNAEKPPKDAPREPGPTPVEYQLTWVDGRDESIFNSDVTGLNDQGVLVGNLYSANGTRGYRWTIQTGMQHVDDLSTTWIDLNTDSSVTGWEAASAKDINEAGQIVGSAVKEGEFTRAYVYQENVGFYLLPTAESQGTYWGQSINEAGDVLGQHGINGSYLDGSLFFWSPRNPSVTVLILSGYSWRSFSQMSDEFFPALPDEADVPNLYSYSVETDGALTYQFATDLQVFSFIGGASSNGLVPFRQYVVTGRGRKQTITDMSGVFDANTDQVKVAYATDHCLPATNTSGDFAFNDPDNMGTVYRSMENTTYKLVDLLDESARAQLYTDGNPISEYEICHRSQINNSNVSGVPAADPYDHVASQFYYRDAEDRLRHRAFILTPVELP